MEANSDLSEEVLETDRQSTDTPPLVFNRYSSEIVVECGNACVLRKVNMVIPI